MESMTNVQEYVVIVDPYSSGKYLVEEFQTQQFPMIGIQSSQDVADFWLEQYDESLFVKTIKHETLERTVTELKPFNVVAVIAGSEPGVFVAEDLQDALSLLSNNAKTKNWRRHKYHMQERLREVGLRAMRQTFAATAEECLEWQKQWRKWPIIVKPAMSGGSDGVYWCQDESDCRLAFDMECGKINVNGELNDKLLCQEFLDGTEYVIDCVSYHGKHLLNCLWVYQKTRLPESKAIVYEYALTIESRGEIQDKIMHYVYKVLDALDIRNGPTHTEVIMVDGEPCLVETNARMHGLKGPKLAEWATGLGTHELVADIFVHGGSIFNRLYESNHHYILKKYALESQFRNILQDGILAEDIDIEKVKRLNSVVDARANVKKGEYLPLTRDCATTPGYFMQVHTSLKQCFADLEYVRQLETSADFYRIVPRSSGKKERTEQNIERAAHDMRYMCSVALVL